MLLFTRKRNLPKLLQKLHTDPEAQVSLRSTQFLFGCFYKSCRLAGFRSPESCSPRLSVTNAPLRFLCDRCDFFFSPPQIPGAPSSEGEGCRLTEECVRAKKINLLAPNCSSHYDRNSHDIIYNRVPISSAFFFFQTRGLERRGKQFPTKLPTFSIQCARHSEQHGPDQHQTSRRLHLLEPGASSPYPGGRRFLLSPKWKGGVGAWR